MQNYSSKKLNRIEAKAAEYNLIIVSAVVVISVMLGVLR